MRWYCLVEVVGFALYNIVYQTHETLEQQSSANVLPVSRPLYPMYSHQTIHREILIGDIIYADSL